MKQVTSKSVEHVKESHERGLAATRITGKAKS